MAKLPNQGNYQKDLEHLLAQLPEGRVPTLLLHSCCAPCSSYVLEYLSTFFAITLFYYNPNIAPQDEYERRLAEQRMLLQKLQGKYPVKLVEGAYIPEDFYAAAKGLEHEPEGGERCFACYELRLRQAAALAREGGFDYFTTTLSISPYKNAQKLHEIGEHLAKEYGVAQLPSDFKKCGGYQRSVALSEEYGLYRQDYCGCVFSKKQREQQKKTSQKTGGLAD